MSHKGIYRLTRIPPVLWVHVKRVAAAPGSMRAATRAPPRTTAVDAQEASTRSRASASRRSMVRLYFWRTRTTRSAKQHRFRSGSHSAGRWCTNAAPRHWCKSASPNPDPGMTRYAYQERETTWNDHQLFGRGVSSEGGSPPPPGCRACTAGFCSFCIRAAQT